MLKDKKLLYLIKTMDLGGAEMFTLNLAEYFKEHFKSVSIASSGGIYEEVLKKKKINHYKISEDLKIQNLLPLSRELNRFIKEEKYDLIHTQHRLVQFALQITPGKNYKNVYTSHNIFNDLYQKMIFPDKAVAISPIIMDNLINTSLIARERILNINLGVKIKKDIQSETKEQPIRFGYTGRLIEEKGIYTLVNVSAKLKEEGYKFSFVFRGKGEDKMLKNIIKKKNLDEIVRVLPPSIINEEIYQDFDVFIIPTKFNEGLPLSILEASAQGKLIITGNAGGITDFIEDNVTGILFNNVTEEEVYQKMKAVILGEIKTKDITFNALKKLKEHFSFEVTSSKYHKLYSQLLS